MVLHILFILTYSPFSVAQ